MQKCEVCDEVAVRVVERIQQFPYGSGEDRVTLSANVPVFECTACGEAYTGEVAERLRHEAVCHHLERLTPAEIRMLRERYDMTQEQFAELSRFGSASIKRWERGNQIQNASADVLLKLLRFPRNLKLVQEMNTPKALKPQFRTKLSERSVQHAKEFRLRQLVESEKAA